MALLLPTRNPFAYPAGVAPGFDPTHVAARNCIFSPIATGSGALNLLTGEGGTLSGSMTAAIDGAVGPATGGANQGSNWWAFSRVPSGGASNLNATLAMIFTPGAAFTGSRFMNPLMAGNFWGYFLDISATASGQVDFINANVLSTGVNGLGPKVGVPMFVAASSNGSTQNYVTVELLTGKTRTGVTNTTLGAPGGAWSNAYFGYTPATGGARNFQGNLAAGMAAFNYLSMQQLLQWAADPWSFWYPHTGIDDFMVGTAGGNAFTLAVNPGLYGFTGEQVVPASARRLYPVQGVFSWAGKSVGVAAQRKVAASQGVFSLTGEAIVPAAQRKSTLSPGIYTLTGEAVTFKAARQVAAATGYFALTSPDIVITKSGSFTLVIATGVFSLAGQPASPIAAHKLSLSDGVFSMAGKSVGVSAGRKVAAAPGSYSLTGEAVGTRRGYGFIAQPGIFSLSGKAITFRWLHVMAAATGSFSFNGQPVSITKGSGVHIIAQPALSGIDSSVLLQGYDGSITLKGWVN